MALSLECRLVTFQAITAIRRAVVALLCRHLGTDSGTTFIAQASLEAFNVDILNWFVGPDQVEFHPMFVGPRSIALPANSPPLSVVIFGHPVHARLSF